MTNRYKIIAALLLSAAALWAVPNPNVVTNHGHSNASSGGNLGTIKVTGITNTSTVTVQGGALSVDTSTKVFQIRAGAVGLGVTAPAAKLQIVGSSTPYANLLQVSSSSTGALYLAVSTGGAVTVSAASSFTALGAVLYAGGITYSGPVGFLDSVTLAGSTLTVSGNAFSVGGSTLSVSNGKVGIGTIASSRQLSVGYTSIANDDSMISVGGVLNATGAVRGCDPIGQECLGIYHGGAGDYAKMDTFFNGSGTSGFKLRTYNAGAVDALTISAAGLVGIGTTSPGTTIDVAGKATFRTGINISGSTVVIRNSATGATPDGSSIALIEATGQSVNLNILTDNDRAGGMCFGDPQNSCIGSVNYQHDVDNLAFLAGASQKMTLTGGGSLGIGTASPGSRLHVSDTTSGQPIVRATKEGSIDSFALYLASNTYTGSSVYAGLRAQTDSGAGFIYRTSSLHPMPNSLVIDEQGGGSITFRTGAEYMRITQGGNVGIGTTSPGHVLTVAGSASISQTLAAANGVITSSLTVQGNAFSVGSSTLVVTGGRVGINTTPSDGVFQVVGKSNLDGTTIENPAAGYAYVTAAGGVAIGQYSTAALDMSFVPSLVGILAYNVTIGKVCVSTGTVEKGSWARIEDGSGCR